MKIDLRLGSAHETPEKTDHSQELDNVKSFDHKFLGHIRNSVEKGTC
jgi:hypothetical protein